MIKQLDVSLSELDVFIAIQDHRSVRAAARARGLKPAYVSKVLARLEAKLGYQLVHRSAAGVTLTRDGLAASRVARAVLESAESLGTPGRDAQLAATRTKVLSVGSMSFLNKHLLAPDLGAWERICPTARIRLLDMAPDVLVQNGLKGAIDLAVHVGPLAWSKAWAVKRIGYMTWGLYAAARHPLGDRASASEVASYPFVVPTYWSGDRYMEGDDFCPLPWAKRLRGHEGATAEGALAIVRATQNLAYVPDIVARSFLETGSIHRLEVREWDEVKRPLFMAVRSDAVSAKMFRGLAAAVATSLQSYG